MTLKREGREGNNEFSVALLCTCWNSQIWQIAPKGKPGPARAGHLHQSRTCQKEKAKQGAKRVTSLLGGLPDQAQLSLGQHALPWLVFQVISRDPGQEATPGTYLRSTAQLKSALRCFRLRIAALVVASDLTVSKERVHIGAPYIDEWSSVPSGQYMNFELSAALVCGSDGVPLAELGDRPLHRSHVMSRDFGCAARRPDHVPRWPAVSPRAPSRGRQRDPQSGTGRASNVSAGLCAAARRW